MLPMRVMPQKPLGPLAIVLTLGVFSGCKGCVNKNTGEGASGGTAQAQTTPGGPQFVVDCKAATKAISPYIYGIAFDITGHSDWKEIRQFELNPSGRRLGGNAASRYNWEHGTAFNHGSDWIFANNGYADAPAPFYDMFLQGNAEKKLQSAVMIQTMGWVAKDMTSVGFPIAKVGTQKVFDDARGGGNGIRPDGSEIPPGPPTNTSIPSTPEFQARYVKKIRELAIKRGVPGPRVYIMDNEPSLWNSTHRDVHPEPLSYDELLKFTKEYATAVRDADPEGLIAGPAAFGWTELFFSAKDAKAGFHLKPDRRAHDDMPMAAWYLKELRAHEQKTGKKMLDLFDYHFYPQAEGIGMGKEGKTDMNTSAIRIRSTRALWDPEYKDESWIKEPQRLLPRLREWIDQYYPGLGIQIGEWNFGAEGDISSGLATAEALGRFADNGVKTAYYWPYPKLDSPAFYAFRAFRNYDGKGGKFEDNLVPAKPMENTSIWASKDASGKHMVVVLLNYSPYRTVESTVALDACGTVASTKHFVYTKDKKAFADGKTAPSGPGVTASLPPYSISVLDITLK